MPPFAFGGIIASVWYQGIVTGAGWRAF
jgi:hypothetical protein